MQTIEITSLVGLGNMMSLKGKIISSMVAFCAKIQVTNSVTYNGARDLNSEAKTSSSKSVGFSGSFNILEITVVVIGKMTLEPSMVITFRSMGS